MKNRLIAVVSGLAGVALVIVFVAAADPMGDRVSSLETRVAVLEDLHGIAPTAEPTATNTGVPPTATSTPVPPTATNTPVPPTETPVPDVGEWHPPTDHEHGDAPPQWVTDWSMAQFGHGVIYGGDEQTPNEWINKPRAFKGYSFTVVADDGQPLDIYARVHMQTNPLGRSAQYHSYEFYAGRNGEVLGFWQGWLDFGTARYSYADVTLFEALSQDPPDNLMLSLGHPGQSVFLDYEEVWYAQLSTPDGWEPVVTVVVLDASTDTDGNVTGNHGLIREFSFRWIAEGSTRRPEYNNRNMADPRGWFCASVHGEILSMGSGTCHEGIPQFISSTMPTVGDTVYSSPKYRKNWVCPDCVMPN